MLDRRADQKYISTGSLRVSGSRAYLVCLGAFLAEGALSRPLRMAAAVIASSACRAIFTAAFGCADRERRVMRAPVLLGDSFTPALAR